MVSRSRESGRNWGFWACPKPYLAWDKIHWQLFLLVSRYAYSPSCGGLSFMLCPLPGSLITVWGTNNRVNTSNGIMDPAYNCSVDNVSITPNPGIPDSNNQILCTTNLNVGPHILTVNVTSLTGQPFWLDALHYAPSSTVSEATAQIIVEQNDLALTYGPGWQSLGPDADMTLVNGAKVSFNFTGMSYSSTFRVHMHINC
jgi:hypothetical protein